MKAKTFDMKFPNFSYEELIELQDITDDYLESFFKLQTMDATISKYISQPFIKRSTKITLDIIKVVCSQVFQQIQYSKTFKQKMVLEKNNFYEYFYQEFIHFFCVRLLTLLTNYYVKQNFQKDFPVFVESSTLHHIFQKDLIRISITNLLRPVNLSLDEKSYYLDIITIARLQKCLYFRLFEFLDSNKKIITQRFLIPKMNNVEPKKILPIINRQNKSKSNHRKKILNIHLD